jgi:hypothetical protein
MPRVLPKLLWFCALAAGTTALALACARPSHLCEKSAECGTMACVAGRCQPEAGVPRIMSTRRLLRLPTKMAALSPRTAGFPAPSVQRTTLGETDAQLLLDFDINLQPEESVVEAYVLLERADSPTDPSSPISLHATRIVEAWTPGSISWARRPMLDTRRTPISWVRPAQRGAIRIDVLELVRQWRKPAVDHHGLAIVSADHSGGGMTFALESGIALAPDVGGGSEQQGPVLSDRGPCLELYVR